MEQIKRRCRRFINIPIKYLSVGDHYNQESSVLERNSVMNPAIFISFRSGRDITLLFRLQGEKKLTVTYNKHSLKHDIPFPSPNKNKPLASVTLKFVWLLFLAAILFSRSSANLNRHNTPSRLGQCCVLGTAIMSQKYLPFTFSSSWRKILEKSTNWAFFFFWSFFQVKVEYRKFPFRDGPCSQFLI